MAYEGETRLVATDLDGTLLRDDKSLPDGFFVAVSKLRANNVHFAIASGRQYANIRKLLEPAADEFIYIADNGAYVNLYGETIVGKAISPENVRRILEVCKTVPTAQPVLSCPEYACFRTESRHVEEDVSRYYESLVCSDALFESQIDGHVLKVAVHDDCDAAKNLWPAFAHMDSGDLSVRVSGQLWLDVMPNGIDKGDALKAVLGKLGLDPSQAMAFGDFENDLGLLQSCQESYAMENAIDRVKRAAKHIAPSNNDDGVVKVLGRVFPFL